MTLTDFISAVPTVLPARRGNLYEQYFERVGANGKLRRHGPYYVWTRCESGRMVSSRIPRENALRVRAEIARGKQLDNLVRELWKLAEDMAREAGDAKKKRSNRSMRQRSPFSRRA